MSVAKQRVDNYGAGFLRTGAKAVFAEGITDASYILYGLFKTSRSIGAIFQSSPNWIGATDFKFQSVRNTQFRGVDRIRRQRAATTARSSATSA